MRRIAIIGNCQATALFSYLRRIPGIQVAAVIDVNVRGSEAYAHALHSVEQKINIDMVFSQPLGDNFEEIATSKLRTLYGADFVGYTNIYFQGIFPDLSYFGTFGKRFHSPLHDYHSKIALIGFLKGLSIEETMNLYCANTYEILNYFSVYNNSMEELRDRDQENIIQFADEFDAMTRQQLTLLTVNHPTAPVLGRLAEQIAGRALGTTVRMPAEFASNTLADSSIWPIYPEIAERLGLHYATPQLYYPNANEGPALHRHEFVAKSFAMYEQYTRKEMEQVPLGQVLRDIPLHL